MKCLCPCPPPPQPLPTSSPLPSPKGAQGRIKQCSQGMAAKQKPEGKKWLFEQQINSEKRKRENETKSGGKGGGRDKEMNAEMRKDAFRSPQVLSDRQGHTDTNKQTHTCTVCSAGFSVCVGFHSVAITLRHTGYTRTPAHALCRDSAQKNMMSCLHTVCVGC